MALSIKSSNDTCNLCWFPLLRGKTLIWHVAKIHVIILSVECASRYVVIKMVNLLGGSWLLAAQTQLSSSPSKWWFRELTHQAGVVKAITANTAANTSITSTPMAGPRITVTLSDIMVKCAPLGGNPRSVFKSRSKNDSEIDSPNRKEDRFHFRFKWFVSLLKTHFWYVCCFSVWIVHWPIRSSFYILCFIPLNCRLFLHPKCFKTGKVISIH